MIPINQIIEGDCRDVLETLPEECINLVLFDPPYSSGQVHKTHAGRYNQYTSGSLIPFDDLSERGFALFIKPILKELYRVQKIGSHFYCYSDWKQLRNLMDFIELASYKLNGVLVWDKQRFGTGRPWRSQIEFIIHASKGKARKGNFLNHANIFNVKRTGKLYEKPIEIASKIIECVTDEGDIVLDPMCGSGNNLIAAKSLNRNYIGIDLSLQPKQAQIKIQSSTQQ